MRPEPGLIPLCEREEAAARSLSRRKPIGARRCQALCVTYPPSWVCFILSLQSPVAKRTRAFSRAAWLA